MPITTSQPTPKINKCGRRWIQAELESKVHRGQWIDPTDKTTVGEYARHYARTRPHGESTAARVESMIRNHVEGTALGSRRLGAVRPSEAQAWVTDRVQVLAPSTVRLLVAFMRGAYAAAVADRLVAESPFARVTLPRDEAERIVPLTVAQVRKLAAAMPERYRAMVVAQAGLGLRISELLALRVQDVDFLRRTARVEHQISRATRERIAPKTALSRRTIPLPDVVSTALAEHLRKYAPAVDGLIFHTSSGRPYPHAFYGTKVFGRAVTKSKLPVGTTSHSLRHYYASVLLAAGESVVAVAERLGHEDAKLVLTTYGHLLPDSEERTRRAVDDAWNAVSEATAEPSTAQGPPR
ncbi:tyrosine-type recombinase/integrase [Pseudonocardia dioxanivorans]|uniref:tyrosine-type recombinase/integrase n=1 Tax=Pseudonocardia dioxanivorans TaxID=240495 RepID=UPI001F309FAB|nr:site-specific integrase [Pseudonocardia dioxanivorans]